MNAKIKNYSDILMSIKPVVTISQIFGLLPLSRHQDMKLSFSKLYFFYGNLLLLVSLIHALLMPLYVIHLNDPRNYKKNSTKDTILHIISILKGEDNGIPKNKATMQTVAMRVINPILLNIMCVSARWISIIKIPAEFPKIIDEIYEADGFFRDKFLDEYSTINKKQHNLCLQSVMLYIMTGFGMNTYYIIGVWEYWGLSFTLIWCTILAFANVTGSVMELQFINIVNLLKVRFEILNAQIYNHINSKNYSDLVYRTRKSFSTEYCKKISPLSTSVVTNNSLLADLGIRRESMTLAKVIEESRQFHHNLCGIVESVNKLYQLQLLCSLTGTFVRGVLNFYFGIFGYASTTGSGSNKNEFSGMLIMICWSVYYMLRFTYMIFCADALTYEAQKSKPLVAVINNRFLDEECKEELLLFSNYMASCKTEFTAYGFFSLNTGLITSAIGAGTTYLVILVQFHTT